MLVEDVMTSDLVVVDRAAAVSVAVERMLTARAGSAIVMEDEAVPVGIVTNSDVLRTALESGGSLTDLAVEAAMSAPLVTVTPDTPVVRAIQRMAENDVKKLPVVEALTVKGIVTTTDIARQLPEYLAEIRRIETERREWTG